MVFFKNIFQVFLNWICFQFLGIILMMFFKSWLFVIAKGMCVHIDFFLPFTSLFLSSFSAVLMCLPNGSELLTLFKKSLFCLSSLQECSTCFDVGEIRLIRNAWLYGMLSFSNFGCSESIWRQLYWSVCFLFILV